MSEAPPFWFEKPGAAAWALSPFSLVYSAVSERRMAKAPSHISSVPVLCVGNFIAGGAGKTPTAIALAKSAGSQGLKVGFLSRGYGGSAKAATLVDPNHHNARDVGDEPLLLAEHAPTAVSVDRPAGAKLLEEAGVDLIIMDDGFQNPSLHKDYSLAVVDARRGLGNGFAHPAGPLRARLIPQLARADALLVIGKSDAGTVAVRAAAKMAKPVLTAQMVVPGGERWRSRRVLAFCGIAHPGKFYDSLEAVGAAIEDDRAFADHHLFTTDECEELLDRAHHLGADLVTTGKDRVRLRGMGEWQQRLHDACSALPVELAFENDKMAEMVIRRTLHAAEQNRLRAKR